MKTLSKLAFATIVAASALALTATDASARIVCNAEGECWHVRNDFVFGPELGLVIHEDGWRWGAGERYRWREHHGHGYWRHGVWIRL
jgi:hypothetical protein